jgi:hypothetical protein
MAKLRSGPVASPWIGGAPRCYPPSPQVAPHRSAAVTTGAAKGYGLSGA